VGFEPTISASEQPQTYALDRAATGTSTRYTQYHKILAKQKHETIIVEQTLDLLGVIVNQYYFQYNGKYFKPTKGIVMVHLYRVLLQKFIFISLKIQQSGIGWKVERFHIIEDM